ncbi:monofunctional biosynthetic peptidoglycan transglycosylase [Desulfovibrio sp. X2]|uniref:monofunctional biosynthetic peptidoglycan transglycosylase n=1 Tax=Desulfovibrio sp. X2 TaxID=941449 RepID=UPI0003FE15A9|nr:monofunctional biosynthetic peptidoglycan transglycosylase [Desulfovibrio sp. X2]
MSRILLLALAALLLAGMVDVGRYAVWPDVAVLAHQNPGKTAFMRWREAQWEREGKKKRITQVWVPLSRVSRSAIMAVTIAEDDKFWNHEGFDFEGMEQALQKDLEKGRIAAGGSTITQQLAKNLWLSPSRNPLRKLKEAILTWRLEKALSKRRILELYLNVAEWGDGIFGIEAAARADFGVSAAGLSEEQAARLAAVLPSPLKWSASHPSRGVALRARIILHRMQRRLGDQG